MEMSISFHHSKCKASFVSGETKARDSFTIYDIGRMRPTEWLQNPLAGQPLCREAVSLPRVFCHAWMDEQAADLSESFSKFQQLSHLRLAGLHWARSKTKLHLDLRKG